MNKRLLPIAVLPLLALAACVPGAAEYSKSEAPAQLRTDGAATRFELAFAPGSARLSPGEATRLDRLVSNGSIGRADRISIAAAGSPDLAARRASAVSGELLRYGIVADPGVLGTVPPNRAIVDIGHYAVTLPACPNWSMPAGSDFTNAPTSNFGCATASNLGLMAASPADIVSGRSLAPADGMPAASAVNRYLNDKVKLPVGPEVGPFAAAGGDQAPSAPPAAGAGPQ